MYFHFLIHAISGQCAPVPTASKEIHMTLVSRWPGWWLMVKTIWRIKENYVNVHPDDHCWWLKPETSSSEPFSRGDEVSTQVIKKCDSCQGEWRRDCNRKNGRIWAIAWVLKHRISDMWISHCEMFFKTNIQQKVEKCVSDIGQREFRNIKLPVFRPRHEDCSACWELKHLDEYIRLKASRSPCPRDWLE